MVMTWRNAAVSASRVVAPVISRLTYALSSPAPARGFMPVAPGYRMSCEVASSQAVATCGTSARCASRPKPGWARPLARSRARTASRPWAATVMPCPYSGLKVATESPTAKKPSGRSAFSK